MSERTRLGVVLLFMRITIFVVMAMWTIDKFVNPSHASHVYQAYYGLGGFGVSPITLIAVVEALILLVFVAGRLKFWTYGFVVIVHGVSTLAAWAQYLDPFAGPNLLFFAAWPMWAAAIALFVLRERDIYTLGRDTR